jgi:hypothetical protein
MKVTTGTTAKRTVGSVQRKKSVAHNEEDYEEFLQQIRDRFDTHCDGKNTKFFTTDADDLFDIFLKGLPAPERQHYTCNACRTFVNRFGGLVSISERGKATPVMWDISSTPPLYRASVQAVLDEVASANVTGVFVSEERTWGTSVTGIWHHMAVKQPVSLVHDNLLLTPFQFMAEKAEDFKP